MKITKSKFNGVKVSSQKPPNFEELERNFGIKWEKEGKKAVVVAYGDTIHCSVEPAPDVVEHELVHLLQQRLNPKEAKKWWKLYIKDPKFRLSQEIPAYRRQFNVLKSFTKDRNTLAKILWRLAQDLSSSQYGSIISHQEALKAIK